MKKAVLAIVACIVAIAMQFCFPIPLIAVKDVPEKADPGAAVAVDADTEPTEPKITRFLLLGCDRSAGLTDSILLVTLNETEKNAHILQIPRDTYANYTQKDYKKLNGAMRSLGVSEMKTFLSDALGVPIRYFVVLNLGVMDDLVDAVGGVDLTIPQDMDYSDPAQNLEIHLKAGPAHLDGEGAEQFVRYRSGYVNADLGRLDAQKIFLQSFAKKCKNLSLPQLLSVAMLALTGVQTDIGIVDAVRITKLLKVCDTDDIPMETLPGQAVQGTSGAWYYGVNREGAVRSIREHLLPGEQYSQADFDKNLIFDRQEHPLFHAVYIAGEKALPVIEGTRRKENR